jgi:exodeoxyribonuclease V beta subunit
MTPSLPTLLPHVLDPLTLPLRGARLIEASAGTGKTWTIAALYVRLVLGHGAPRPLLPAEILVMTFTKAATRELAERIRARLAEAAAVLRGEPATPDAFLTALAADLGEDRRLEAAWRLTQAAQAMDEASIHTIDAWCQKVLREHALTSGSPLDEELVADEAALLHEAVRDWWRREVYPLVEADYAVWRAHFAHVDSLATEVRRTLALLDVAAPPALAPGDLAHRLAEERRALQALKAGWDAAADEIEAWLLPLLADGAPKRFNGTKLKTAGVHKAMAALREWARHPALARPQLTAAARWRYTPDGIVDALTKGASVECPPVIERLAALLDTLDARPALRPRLLVGAAQAVAVRLAELKRRQQLFGFADPLQRLEAALAGLQGETLRERLLAACPVALVDEFQDTAPRQYRLFERLYRPREQDPHTALLLIGDPKQSIYGFRGADIYSYLRARHDTAPHHDALGTNHRSSAALVAAVNQLFEQAEARRAGGAFALRDAHWSLPFTPVAAKGRPERLVAHDGAVPALTLLHAVAPMKAGALRRHFAALAAEQVVAWLGDARCGFEDGGAFKRLVPADIAVLVRDRKEAAAVRRALQLRGVASVYLSDQASVFATHEAVDLLRWIEAVAQPLDARLARAAYASPTLGLSWHELAAQAQDEAAWDARVALLRELHGRWQQQGVLAMLRLTLHRLQLAARLLAQPEGERSLTNVLHLAELLQGASTQLDGEPALVRWLAERIAEAQGGAGDDAGLGDERIVRLESDAGLVQVITVHKSKGLEYPLVLLPFAGGCSMDDSGAALLTRLHDDGARSLVFEPDEALRETVRQERLREDLRLLYVALTRARHALWLGVAIPGKGQAGLHAGALGHLLGLSKDVPPDALPEALADALHSAWAPLAGSVLDGQPALRLRPAPEHVPTSALAPADDPPALIAPPPYTADFERRWSVGSYSSVVRGHAAAEPSAWIRVRDEVDDAPAEARPVPAAWHAFPRGATPGNFLHDQLQWLAEQGFASLDEPAVQQALLRRCERAGHAPRAEAVLHWLQALVHTPLPALQAPLSALTVRVPELEFWMPVERLPAPLLDRLCREHLMPGTERPALPQRELKGLLMGFADLVFEHAGRYWVLDYKSNALGDDDAAYGPAALRAAMAAHRYDVQAALYTAALHRLLRERLGPAYDPERQLGGALYLFLRGIHGREQGCVHLPPSWPLLDALDAMFDGVPA